MTMDLRIKLAVKQKNSFFVLLSKIKKMDKKTTYFGKCVWK